MSESTVTGDDILSIANACWNAEKQRYRGWQWMLAVNKAKANIEKVKGQGKARKTEAEHQVTVLFNHARNQTPDRLKKVAYAAQNQNNHAIVRDLNDFAAEVSAMLNGPLDGGYGVVDIAMIVTLITAIVNAIRACKAPAPTPQPT